MRNTMLAALAATTLIASAGVAQSGGRPLSATLEGENEVPAPGDPDGTGSASVTVNPGTGQVCYTLTVSGIAPATMAHIHEGEEGVAGPVRIGLTPPTSGTSTGCASTSREQALEILKDPSNYYVNVHNAEFPGGALRGQLGK